jgi:DNA-binding NtrC family response regulator
MPMAVQAKLLRALQEQEIEPLGSNRMVKVDVRLITATNLNLEERVKQGRWRSDLYYRLNVLSIRLPPLRERLQDLDALCELILAQIAERTGLAQREMSHEAIAALAAYSWPGNIRELRNVLEKASMLSEQRRLQTRDLAAVLPVFAQPDSGAAASLRSLAQVVADAERAAIRAALQAAHGNKSLAAQALGVSRGTLYEKLAQLGLGTREQHVSG